MQWEIYLLISGRTVYGGYIRMTNCFSYGWVLTLLVIEFLLIGYFQITGLSLEGWWLYAHASCSSVKHAQTCPVVPMKFCTAEESWRSIAFEHSMISLVPTLGGSSKGLDHNYCWSHSSFGIISFVIFSIWIWNGVSGGFPKFPMTSVFNLPSAWAITFWLIDWLDEVFHFCPFFIIFTANKYIGGKERWHRGQASRCDLIADDARGWIWSWWEWWISHKQTKVIKANKDNCRVCTCSFNSNYATYQTE